MSTSSHLTSNGLDQYYDGRRGRRRRRRRERGRLSCFSLFYSSPHPPLPFLSVCLSLSSISLSLSLSLSLFLCLPPAFPSINPHQDAPQYQCYYTTVYTSLPQSLGYLLYRLPYITVTAGYAEANQ